MAEAIFVTMIQQVKSWIDGLNQRKTQQTNQIRSALKAVAFATTETRSYFAMIRDDKNSGSRDQERALAHLWEEAGIEIATVNRDLAERFFMKAEYWSDPKGWTLAGRDSSAIELDQLSEAARRALLTQ
jgi:hypothetical protein